MTIDSIKLKNFRNYESVSLKFSPNINIIYGKNGSGKTNIVEAIYVLSLSKSFRCKEDISVIMKGKDYTVVEGSVLSKYKNNYQITLSESGKKAKINKKLCSKLSDYISNINIILFEPNEEMIFKLAPSNRRKMLDIEISQLDNSYLVLLSNYNRVLKQRNFYLREMMINSTLSVDYLNILTSKLIEYGIIINSKRSKFIDMINEYIGFIYKDIFESGELYVKYNSVFNNKSEDDLLKIYNDKIKYDINTGKTNIGIQHDDIDFILNDNNIRDFGSVGEQKNAIFSFKLSEIEIFKSIKNDNPILILDDVFSELDKNKVKNIIKILDGDIQTFITTTEVERISKKLRNNAKKFRVKNGVIEEVNNER
jgi:DNA replication and repair protein RecF